MRCTSPVCCQGSTWTGATALSEITDRQLNSSLRSLRSLIAYRVGVSFLCPLVSLAHWSLHTTNMSEYSVHTSLLFDPKKLEFLENVTVTVDRDTGLISAVTTRESADAEVKDGDVDLRGKVVLPGLVDAHTHIFLHAYA